MLQPHSPFDNVSGQSELISPIDYQTNNPIVNGKENCPKFENEISYCHACHGPILDRVVLKVGSSTWHVRCLHCIDCGVPLIDKCYCKNDDVFCKEDFFRRYGTRCAGCDEVIPPAEVIRKAQNFIYHIDCFACINCHRQLNTGEEFFLLPSKKLMCRPDFEIAKAKELDQGNKRPRTTITAKQLEALKKTYSESSKPARHVREQLSAKTGLDMRVVQVWFQNRRAKEKRMKKDASRGCWNTPYFQSNGSSCKVSSIKDDSDDQSDDQTNEPIDVTYQSDVESDSDVFSCYGGGGTTSNTNISSSNNSGPPVSSVKRDHSQPPVQSSEQSSTIPNSSPGTSVAAAGVMLMDTTESLIHTQSIFESYRSQHQQHQQLRDWRLPLQHSTFPSPLHSHPPAPQFNPYSAAASTLLHHIAAANPHDQACLIGQPGFPPPPPTPSALDIIDHHKL